MTSYRTMKPRPPGSIYDAITKAIGQIEGGLSRAAEVVDRPRSSLHAAGDPDTPDRKRVKLSFAEACKLANAGGTALAEHIAHEAGGVFVPAGAIDQAALQAQLASFSAESGELVSEIIKRVADGDFCASDGAAGLQLIDDALRPLLALRHHCKTRASSR